MALSNEQVKKRNRQMVLILVAVVVVAVVLFGGGAYLFAKMFTGHVKTANDYSTMQLVASNYADDLVLDGEFEAASSVTVATEVDGTVKTVEVEEGDVVEEGDTLFTMENSDIEEALSKARSALATARSERDAAREKLASGRAPLQEAKASLRKAERVLARQQAKAETRQAEDPEYEPDLTVYEDAVTAAQSQVDSVQPTVDALQEVLDSKKSAVATAQSTYNDALAQSNKLTVTSPEAGTVSNLAIEKGSQSAVFNASGGAMKIIDTGTILCVVRAPESQVSNLTRGMQATVTCSLADTDAEMSATISKISDTPSSGSNQKTEKKSTASNTSSSESVVSEETYYDVTLTLGQVDSSVKVGMAATAEIQIKDYGTVYYVPANAVGTNNAGLYVEAVFEGGTTKQYQVTQLGTNDAGELIIQGSSLSNGMNIRTDLQ